MRIDTPLVLLALGIISASGCASIGARATEKADQNNERRSIELVIYSGDFGMVNETRRVELSAGTKNLGLREISKSLDQNSLFFSWPEKGDAKVLSSTYEMGLDNSQHLLKRLIGKEVELVYHGLNGKSGDRIKGILEIAEPGNIVVRADGRYIINPNATIEAPSDENIALSPQMSVEVESKSGGPKELAVSYMTEGLSWNADYVAVLSPELEDMGLECWATVTNKTGVDFPNAQIKFVAGSPNRAVRARGRPEETRYKDFELKASFRESDLSGYSAFNSGAAMGELYAYPYLSKASIRQDQMNRVRMMENGSVKVKRVYSVRVPTLYRDYTSAGNNPDKRITAQMGVNFTNNEDSGLGQPLPAGAVRVYEPDKSGVARYIGAASLIDTPKDARVNLSLTNVFDVYAQVRQVSTKRIDKHRVSREIEVRLTNEKPYPVQVRLVQDFGGTWKIATESVKSQRLGSSTNQWEVTAPAGGQAALRYSVTLGS